MPKIIVGQTYEDSIQELNNLIGELDSFQREHELKMRQKHREKQQPKQSQPQPQQSKLLANGSHDVHNTSADTTMTASSIDDMSDIYNSLDKLSISSCDPNPLMCSTITHSSSTYGSDIGDGFNDLTDCQATTMSLKLNLSTTEHPLVMHHHHHDHHHHSNSTNSLNTMNGTSMASQSSSNGSTVIRNIELIPDSYNVSDDYVKEHTEIVVLRRKNSLNDLNAGQERVESVNHLQNTNGNSVVSATTNGNASNGKDVERISSFRCSSFAKTDGSHSNDGKSTLKRGQSMSSADANIAHANRYNGHEYTGGMSVMMQYDQDVVDHIDTDNSPATAHMIRPKPIITPRPASLSGLF